MVPPWWPPRGQGGVREGPGPAQGGPGPGSWGPGWARTGPEPRKSSFWVKIDPPRRVKIRPQKRHFSDPGGGPKTRFPGTSPSSAILFLAKSEENMSLIRVPGSWGYAKKRRFWASPGDLKKRRFWPSQDPPGRPQKVTFWPSPATRPRPGDPGRQGNVLEAPLGLVLSRLVMQISMQPCSHRHTYTYFVSNESR